MPERKYVKELPVQVYETDKILRVEPQRLQRLGLYTIRIMLPPGAEAYAVESPAAIISTEHTEVDKWLVNFNMYDSDNSGSIVDTRGQFTEDGHMYIDNSGPKALDQFGSKIKMGYFAGDIHKNPLELTSATVIPESLEGINADSAQLTTT